jgi:class 3 adenylate cyclase
MAQTENLTVMFTDIVGYTELTSRQSRAQNSAMLRDHNRILLPLVARFGGRRVKSIGDSLMLGFRSPTDAVRCGMAMHDALAEYNYRRADVEQIHIRVAINVGEVRVDGSDIFGEAVNVASRVEHLTPPDNVYFTEAVYLAMNKAEVPCVLVGRHKLKGIPEAVKLFTVPPRQVNRLIPGGEELGEAPGELPFGGMHRAAPTVGPVAILINRVRSLPITGHSAWKEWLIGPALTVPPPSRLAPMLGGLALAAFSLIWSLSRGDEGALPRAQTSASMATPDTAALSASPPAVLAATPPTSGKEAEAREWLDQANKSFERNRRREAAPAYARALDLQPTLQDDPTVANRVVACLSWASDLAIPIIKKYPSAAMIGALSKRTAQARDLGGQRAADLLNELGFADRVDPYYIATTELESAGSCDAKKAAIARIRTLHDPRTLPALKSALGSGIGGWFKSSCYRAEAKAAIAEIERTSPR